MTSRAGPSSLATATSSSSAAAAVASKFKRKAGSSSASNPEWSWEDEMLMYDVSQRDAHKKRRRLEKDETTDEMRAIKKEQEAQARCRVGLGDG